MLFRSLLIEPRAANLLHTARAILGDNWDAYEAAQETLIAAWVQLPTLRDADRFDAWLTRTLVNRCRDALRKRKRGREIDLSETEIAGPDRSAEHTSELQSLMRISYAVFCLKKKTNKYNKTNRQATNCDKTPTP